MQHANSLLWLLEVGALYWSHQDSAHVASFIRGLRKFAHFEYYQCHGGPDHTISGPSPSAISNLKALFVTPPHLSFVLHPAYVLLILLIGVPTVDHQLLTWFLFLFVCENTSSTTFRSCHSLPPRDHHFLPSSLPPPRKPVRKHTTACTIFYCSSGQNPVSWPVANTTKHKRYEKK